MNLPARVAKPAKPRQRRKPKVDLPPALRELIKALAIEVVEEYLKSQAGGGDPPFPRPVQ